MKPRSLVGLCYHFCEWIMKLVYVNVLFITFTLLGGIVFGVAPAITSMFAVIRQWMLGEQNMPIFTSFWHAYRKDFFNANILGFVLAIMGCIVYLDLRFSVLLDSKILKLLILAVLILYFTICLYIFPVFVHYELKFIQYFKNAFFIALSQALSTILMMIALYFIYLLFSLLPGLIPFLGGSLISFVLMKIAYFTFSKLEQANLKTVCLDDKS